MPDPSSAPAVAIAGAHGKIALLLSRLLIDAGIPVRGLIRNPEHAEELRALGVEPHVVDLERDDPALGAAVGGAGAVVFAAGAGPGSGAPRKLTMDRDGALRLIHACRETGVDRYVMISAMGARGEIAGDDVFSVYLGAKRDADAALVRSGLRYTVVRPGSLNDDPPTGRVELAPSWRRDRSPAPMSPRRWWPSCAPRTRSAPRSTSSAVRRRSRTPSPASFVSRPDGAAA